MPRGRGRVPAWILAMIALLPATTLAAAVTHVYKIVNDMPIHADVYAGESAAPRPVLMWIHGGALIFGHRDMLDPGLREHPRRVTTSSSIMAIWAAGPPKARTPSLRKSRSSSCKGFFAPSVILVAST